MPLSGPGVICVAEGLRRFGARCTAAAAHGHRQHPVPILSGAVAAANDHGRAGF